MIEFTTALAAASIALGWSFWIGRALLRRGSLVRTEAARAGVLRHAILSLLGPSSRSLLVIAVLIAFVGFVALGIVRARTPADPAASSVALGGWTATALLAGTVGSIATAYLASWAALRSTSIRAARSANLVALLLAPSAFGAFVPVFFAFALLIALCIAAAFATGAAARPVDGQLAWNMAQLVVAFGAGTSLGALFYRLAGGWFYTSTVVRTGGSDDAKPQAALRGAVNFAAENAVDIVSTVSVGVAASLLQSAWFGLAHVAQLHSPAAVALFPIVAMGFGTAAAAVATMVVRTEEGESLLAGLGRGLAVATLLSFASLFGATHWLFDRLWPGPFVAAASGLGLAVVALVVGALTTNDAQGAVNGWSRGLAVGRGFQRAALLLFVGFACSFGGAHLPALTGLSESYDLGMAAAVVGFLMPAPFLLVGAGFDALLPTLQDRPHGTRTHRDRLTGASSAYMTTAALIVGLLAVAAYSKSAAVFRTGSGATSMLAADHLVGASAAAGAVLVLIVVGHLLATTAHVVRRVCESAETTSSAAETTELAYGAVRQAIASTLILLGMGAVAWLLVVLVAGIEDAVQRATTALSGLLVVMGSSFSAALGGVRPDPSRSRMSSVDGPGDSANNPARGAAVMIDRQGIPFGYVAGPALHALTRLLSAVVVALAPLVH
jgi:hypothetical protein